MMTKKFDFQGYDEYHPSQCQTILDNLIGPCESLFSKDMWPKLTHLSLTYFDWSWCSLESWSQQKKLEYRKNVQNFYQAIGQNLPNLTSLEIAYSQYLKESTFMWLFLDSKQHLCFDKLINQQN